MKMSNCTSATHALFANAWVNALRLVRGTSIVDSKRLAKINANDVLEQLNEHEERIHKELRDIALAVRQTKKEKLTSSQMALLQRSRNKRQELTLVSKKKKAIHNHIDTLEVSELNEKVLSSVQETAGVLKSQSCSAESIFQVVALGLESENFSRFICQRTRPLKRLF